MRDFYPTTGRSQRKPNELDVAEGLVNQTANRRLSDMRHFGIGKGIGDIGRESSPDDLRATAAYQLLKKKAQATSLGPAPERLSAQADLQEFEEQQALKGASRDIETGWRAEVGTTPLSNAYTGNRIDGKPQHLTQRTASAMANNQSMGRATPIAGEPSGEDPRLTVQGRNQLGRVAARNPNRQAGIDRAASQQRHDAMRQFAEAGGSPTDPAAMQNPIAALAAMASQRR